VAGDFKKMTAKEWIQKYFGPIKKELKLLDLHLLKNQLHKLLNKIEDANIQIPAIVVAYRTPSMKTRDARVLI
jgi:predicted Zn-dependent peptidase